MRDYDFYIVPTPIGNLGDITARAIEVLKSVDIIACEDCRNTQKLLNHFSIRTRCISYHKFNEKERVRQFISLIKEGKKIALVSDAGTPLFCDPGAIIVKELQKENIRITALPGANAAVTFLSQIPRATEDFIFIGFLPKSKKQTYELLTKHKNENTLFYDSPNRLLDTLYVIKDINPDAIVSVGRELTKLYEEVLTDNITNIISNFTNREIKGEIVVMIHAFDTDNTAEMYIDKINKLKEKKFSDKDISIILSILFDLNKNDVYDCLLNKKGHKKLN